MVFSTATNSDLCNSVTKRYPIRLFKTSHNDYDKYLHVVTKILKDLEGFRIIIHSINYLGKRIC